MGNHYKNMEGEAYQMLWTQFKTHLVRTQQALYQDKHFTDVTLVSDDQIQITAHKVVLSSCSSFLRNLLVTNPHPHPMLYLRGIKQQHMEAIIQYMYWGEAKVLQEDIDEFISVCNDLKLKDLCSVSTKDLNNKDESKSEESKDMFVNCGTVTHEEPVEDIEIIKLQNSYQEDEIPSPKIENRMMKIATIESTVPPTVATVKGEESVKDLVSDDMMSKDMMPYDLLPCSPYSNDWRALGSSMVRGVLTKMLGTAGYGRCGKIAKLGVGSPPAGWPGDVISWPGFKGSTRSRLTFPQITEIIISMLEAAGLDPETHVLPGGVAEYIHQDVGNTIVE